MCIIPENHIMDNLIEHGKQLQSLGFFADSDTFTGYLLYRIDGAIYGPTKKAAYLFITKEEAELALTQAPVDENMTWAIMQVGVKYRGLHTKFKE